jgi:hypothetical protein
MRETSAEPPSLPRFVLCCGGYDGSGSVLRFCKSDDGLTLEMTMWERVKNEFRDSTPQFLICVFVSLLISYAISLLISIESYQRVILVPLTFAMLVSGILLWKEIKQLPLTRSELVKRRKKRW